MSMTTSVTVIINGVTTTIPVQYELTTGAVFDAYGNSVNAIQNALFQTSGAAAPPITDPTAIQNALNSLLNLVLNGQQVATSTGTVTNRITYTMSVPLNQLFQSLEAAGATVVTNTNPPTVSFPTLAVLQNWQNLVTSTAILQGLFSIPKTDTSEHSLQALVELDYVRAGNELINQKMTDLQSALTTTQNVINDLGGLQNIHNQLVINSPGSFTSVTRFNWSATSGPGATTDASTYQSFYKAAASAFYGQAISPVLAVPSGSSYIISPAMKQLWDLASSSTNFAQRAQVLTSSGQYQVLTLADAVQPAVATSFDQPTCAALGLNYPPTATVFSGVNGVLINGYIYTPVNPYAVNGGINIVYAMQRLAASYTGVQTAQGFTLVPPTGDPLQTQLMSILGAIPTGIINSIQNLVKIRNSIAAEVATLSAANGSAAISPTSLLGQLKQVLSDLNSTFVTNGVPPQPVNAGTSLLSAYSGFSAWMLDKYNTRTTSASSNQAGTYQQNITFAITAAQSTNDQQSEQVRQFLYVFEQFYQSASAILQQITQIITRMAQGIAR